MIYQSLSSQGYPPSPWFIESKQNLFTRDHWSVTHRSPEHTIMYHFRWILILSSYVIARIHCSLFSSYAAVTSSYALLTQAACQGKPSLRVFDNYIVSKNICPCKKSTGLKNKPVISEIIQHIKWSHYGKVLIPCVCVCVCVCVRPSIKITTPCK
jgi:hypothetical protein